MLFDAGDGDFQHQSRPAVIGNNKIAAAAQNKQSEFSCLRECDCFLHITDRLGFDEEVGWTSEAERGERSQGNVFLKQHSWFQYTQGGRKSSPLFERPP